MFIPESFAASNAIFIIMFGVIPLQFILAGFDGGSIHGFGTLGQLAVKKRYVGVFGGIGIIFALVTSTMLFFGINPIQLWVAACEYVSGANGTGFMGFGIGIAALLTLTSPVFAVVALLRIRSVQKKMHSRQTYPVYA